MRDTPQGQGNQSITHGVCSLKINVLPSVMKASSIGNYNFKATNGMSGNHGKRVFDCQRGHKGPPMLPFIQQ